MMAADISVGDGIPEVGIVVETSMRTTGTVIWLSSLGPVVRVVLGADQLVWVDRNHAPVVGP